MPIDDGCREVFVGDDLGGQPMAHDLHQVSAGEKFGRIAMGQALLGQEHGRDHDQGHVMVPRLPAADLILLLCQIVFQSDAESMVACFL